MSLDSSLKIGGGLVRHRNVLTRAERIAKLQQNGSFDNEKDSPLGLVKVAHRKLVTAKKPKKKAEEEK